MIAYLGGKTRLAKHIVPVIEMLRQEHGNGDYKEPFVGGGSILCKVNKDIGDVFASDANGYLIDMYKSIQKGWVPPKTVDEETYKNVKNNRDSYPPQLVAFVGFSCSFARKWFGGYARDKENTNYAKRASDLIVKRRAGIDSVIFRHCGYDDVDVKAGDVVYCDPPYKDTVTYDGVSKFDYANFYNWIESCADAGAIVLVSEYNMPVDDFVCVCEFTQKVGLSQQGDIKNKKRVERLFMHKHTSKEIIESVKNFMKKE